LKIEMDEENRNEENRKPNRLSNFQTVASLIYIYKCVCV